MFSSMVPAILIGWIPAAILLFYWMPPRRALIFGVLAATMFLPMGTIDLPFIVGQKGEFTALGLLAGALIMEPWPLLAVRPRWIDLPMLCVCLVPAASAVTNGQDAYAAAAAVASAFCRWGILYWLGRAYLTDLRSLWQLANAYFIAGLIYAPGCIFEVLLSPKLHKVVYGYNPFEDWQQAIRWGGYRPTMFMQHGLMVGTFMCGAAMVGVWLWWNKALRPTYYGVPSWVFVVFLVLVGIACKSTGAVILMAAGLSVLIFARQAHTRLAMYLLAAVPLLYVVARTIGEWSGSSAVEFAYEHFNADSGGSLQMRFENENRMIARAMQRPLFGWGNSDEFLKNDEGTNPSVPDGLWVIALGTTGTAGLAALFAAILIPAVALAWRFRNGPWDHPKMAAPAALAVLLIIYAADCLMNAMIDPVYAVALGGVAAVAVAKPGRE